MVGGTQLEDPEEPPKRHPLEPKPIIRKPKPKKTKKKGQGVQIQLPHGWFDWILSVFPKNRYETIGKADTHFLDKFFNQQ